MKFIVKDDFDRETHQYLRLQKVGEKIERWWLPRAKQATVFDTRDDINILKLKYVKIIQVPEGVKSEN